jgi:hypothetical protein
MRRTLSRGKLSELVAQLPPYLIGMEACSGAHEVMQSVLLARPTSAD